ILLKTSVYCSICIIFIVVFLSCKNSGGIDNNIVNGETGRVVDSIMQLNHENGFSGYVFIIKENEIIYSKGFGYSDKELLITIDKSTVFDIGSLTKQFTAAAILKLEMEGKLSVSNTLSTFFSDIPEDKKDINIHQLLTHTSGFRWGTGDEYEVLNKEAMLKRAFSSELESESGKEFNYSHMGYNILGAIIEEASGISYEEYLNEKLFKPAGMKNTGYIIPVWDNEKISHGYTQNKDWGKPTDHPWSDKGPYWNFHASGGILSTPEDMFKWDKALKTNKILSEDVKERFFMAHVSRGDRRSPYGYGWSVFSSRRNTTGVVHNGGNGKFFNELMRYIDDEVTIYVCSNNAPRGVSDLSDEIANILFTENHTPKTSIIKVITSTEVPDNIKGDRIRRFLSLNESSDKSIMKKFISNNCSEYLIEKHSIDSLTSFMKFYYRRTGTTEIKRIDMIGENRSDIYLYSTNKNMWYKLIFWYTHDENKLVNAINFNRTDPIEE
ncbi:serine hydrolase domain-containing protein, partial [Bacteroidota bacterium]